VELSLTPLVLVKFRQLQLVEVPEVAVPLLPVAAYLVQGASTSETLTLAVTAKTMLSMTNGKKI
jgi:hypothetical protein